MILQPRRHTHCASLLALAALLLLEGGRAHADPLYTVTNLGNLDVVGGDHLNDAGDVAGNVGGTNSNPTLYHSYGAAAGTFIDLSGVIGANTGVAGITDSGTVLTVRSTRVVTSPTRSRRPPLRPSIKRRYPPVSDSPRPSA